MTGPLRGWNRCQWLGEVIIILASIRAKKIGAYD